MLAVCFVRAFILKRGKGKKREDNPSDFIQGFWKLSNLLLMKETPPEVITETFKLSYNCRYFFTEYCMCLNVVGLNDEEYKLSNCYFSNYFNLKLILIYVCNMSIGEFVCSFSSYYKFSVFR